jgi:hypothetical protein
MQGDVHASGISTITCNAERQTCDRRRVEDAITDDPERVPTLLGHEDVTAWQKSERPRIDQPDGSHPDGRGRCPENLQCIEAGSGTAGRRLLSAAGRGPPGQCERRDRRGRMLHPHQLGHAQLLAGGRQDHPVVSRGVADSIAELLTDDPSDHTVQSKSRNSAFATLGALTRWIRCERSC